MTITTKENANGRICAYYIDGVKTRKGEIEYFACNPAYDGIIEIDLVKNTIEESDAESDGSDAESDGSDAESDGSDADNNAKIAYEEWRDDCDPDENAFLERQDEQMQHYRLEKLYGAVGTFDPYWKNNIHFFQAKFMQDKGLESIYGP